MSACICVYVRWCVCACLCACICVRACACVCASTSGTCAFVTRILSVSLVLSPYLSVCNRLHARVCPNICGMDVSPPCSACTHLLHACVHNTLQHAATRCNTLQHTALPMHPRVCLDTHTPPIFYMHAFSACTRLQHTAILSNIPQHAATDGNTPQHTALSMLPHVCPDTHAHTLTPTHIFRLS